MSLLKHPTKLLRTGAFLFSLDVLFFDTALLPQSGWMTSGKYAE